MAKLTRKSYKRKRIITGVALFMSIALISTGFAAFVISSQATGDGQGNVEVGTVTDKTLSITVDNKNNLGSLVFDISENDTHGLVRKSDTGPYEKLDIVVTGSITNADFVGSLNFKFEELGGTQGLKDAAAKNYISLPDCFSDNGVTYTASNTEKPDLDLSKVLTPGENNNGRFSFKIAFNWGSAFNGKNPGYYYDNREYVDGSWVNITENKFDNTAANATDTIKTTLLDLRKTIYSIEDSNYSLDNQDNDEYVTKAPKYKLTITATVK